jgi:hypothetical protein
MFPGPVDSRAHVLCQDDNFDGGGRHGTTGRANEMLWNGTGILAFSSGTTIRNKLDSGVGYLPTELLDQVGDVHLGVHDFEDFSLLVSQKLKTETRIREPDCPAGVPC